MTPAANEERIVWLTHPERRPRYVRETTIYVPTRQRRPAAWRFPGRPVAYAVLRATASANLLRRGEFERRVWWLAAHDPYPGEHGAPAEAVDPLSVRAGLRSLRPHSPDAEDYRCVACGGVLRDGREYANWRHRGCEGVQLCQLCMRPMDGYVEIATGICDGCNVREVA